MTTKPAKTALLVCLLLGISACLSGCEGGESGADVRDQQGHQSAKAAAIENATKKLAEINLSYSENTVKAQQLWAGKRFVVGGEFDSAGKNSDGTTSVLVSPGDMPPTLGEFNVGRASDETVGRMGKGDHVIMECTVDPSNKGFVAAFIDCKPADAER